MKERLKNKIKKKEERQRESQRFEGKSEQNIKFFLQGVELS